MENSQWPQSQWPGQPTQTPQPPIGEKLTWFRRFRDFIQRHRVATIIICSVLIIFLGSAIAYMLIYKPPVAQVPSAVTVQKQEELNYYAALSGVKVSKQSEVTAPVTAVMIENSPSARPQSGLKQAEVVYEAVAEGGITRFLVLYQQNKPSLIGPVRSIREYYVDWMTPYDVCIAHVGGSAAALKTVRKGGYCDMDQFFNAGTYWRATDRYPPHNVYTDSKKLSALEKAKKHTQSDFTGFARQDTPEEMPKTNAANITINFSSASFNTTYKYNAKSNTYARSIAGKTHKDREKGALTPNVVVAMKVKMTAVSQDGYRESINTTGKGDAIIFQNGTATKVTWKKSSVDGELSFVDSDGKEVALNRGQTWIAAVPTNRGGGVSWK